MVSTVAKRRNSRSPPPTSPLHHGIVFVLRCCSSLTCSDPEAEVDAALIYAAAFYGNLGNYKSFGDTKFVPGIGPDRLEVSGSTTQPCATS